MFCHKCGHELPENSKFCPKCGVTIQQAKGNNDKAIDPAGTPRIDPDTQHPIFVAMAFYSLAILCAGIIASVITFILGKVFVEDIYYLDSSSAVFAYMLLMVVNYAICFGIALYMSYKRFQKAGYERKKIMRLLLTRKLAIGVLKYGTDEESDIADKAETQFKILHYVGWLLPFILMVVFIMMPGLLI